MLKSIHFKNIIMEVKIDFLRASVELKALLEKKMTEIEDSGLELDIKGFHYVEHAKRALGMLESIKSEYYTQYEIDTLLATLDIASNYIKELHKYTNEKDLFRF